MFYFKKHKKTTKYLLWTIPIVFLVLIFPVIIGTYVNWTLALSLLGIVFTLILGFIAIIISWVLGKTANEIPLRIEREFKQQSELKLFWLWYDAFNTHYGAEKDKKTVFSEGLEPPELRRHYNDHRRWLDQIVNCKILENPNKKATIKKEREVFWNVFLCVTNKWKFNKSNKQSMLCFCADTTYDPNCLYNKNSQGVLIKFDHNKEKYVWESMDIWEKEEFREIKKTLTDNQYKQLICNNFFYRKHRAKLLYLVWGWVTFPSTLERLESIVWLPFDKNTCQNARRQKQKKG